MVKRFDIEETSKCYDSYRDMVEYHDGEYVLSEDYDREITRLREQLADAEKVISATESIQTRKPCTVREFIKMNFNIDDALDKYRKKYGGGDE